MVFKLSSILSFAALASAAVCAPQAPACMRQENLKAPLDPVTLQSRQPTQGLPSNSNVTLQRIALGVGIQNYSCASTTSTPTSIGAIATLFDVQPWLQQCGNLQTSDLSRAYLKAYNQQSCQASTDLDNNDCQTEINFLNFPVIGHHWFNSINGAGVPFFEIIPTGQISGQKVGDVPAPSGAFNGGKNGHGAVDWLFLTSDSSGLTSGLSEVYRIHTAGGNPAPDGCASGEKVLSYKYAAEYWFYL
jgi:hypothetical protein